ncbi:MAG: hypothetical protein EXR76_09265, partial [Myxococcales bacterium]|nr:hypothetical protein [Myxococcales bacterium]
MAFLLLAGCADGAPNEKSSDETPRGCTPNTCVEECALDRDCGPGQRCQSGACESDEVPDMGEGRCVRNSDCEDGFGCDAESRTCVPVDLPNRSCDDERDCFAGERCLMNTCVQPPDAGGDRQRDAEVVDGPRLEQGVVDLGVADVALAD